MGSVQCALVSWCSICIFLQQYRIHMDIRNSKNHLGISVIITITSDYAPEYCTQTQLKTCTSSYLKEQTGVAELLGNTNQP